jgi:hypothetical protein
MRIPNFEKIKEADKNGFKISSYASGIHPNPKFYKYYWHVFWEDSPCDGKEFFDNKYRMSTKSAMDLIDKLKIKDKPCWLYNRRLPRADVANPFDVNSKVWKDSEWAVSFDEDTDKIYQGHK